MRGKESGWVGGGGGLRHTYLLKLLPVPLLSGLHRPRP